MSRNLDPDILAALSSSNFKLGLFVDLEFPEGTQYYTSMARPTTWNGNSYVEGKILYIDPMGTSLDFGGRPGGITFSLQQAEFATLVTSRSPLLSRITIHLVPANSQTDVLSSQTESVILYRGYVTHVDSNSNTSSNTVKLSLSSAMQLAFKPYRLRYNHYEQGVVLGYTDDVGLRGVGIYNTDRTGDVEGLAQQTQDFFAPNYVPAPIDP